MASHIKQIEEELAQAKQELNKFAADVKKKEREIKEITQALEALKIGTPNMNEEGLSCSFLMLDVWHSRHPNASLFLFGIGTWTETKIFYRWDISQSGTRWSYNCRPPTEFEQVLVARMRMQRRYEYQTLA
jgi:hypothetical protein